MLPQTALAEGQGITRAEGSGESGVLAEGQKSEKSRRQSAKKPAYGDTFVSPYTPIFEENRGGDWGPLHQKWPKVAERPLLEKVVKITT